MANARQQKQLEFEIHKALCSRSMAKLALEELTQELKSLSKRFAHARETLDKTQAQLREQDVEIARLRKTCNRTLALIHNGGAPQI